MLCMYIYRYILIIKRNNSNNDNNEALLRAGAEIKR